MAFQKKLHKKLTNGNTNQHIKFVGPTQFIYENISINTFSHNNVVVNVIYCDNNFMVIGKEHVFQIISHNYTT